MPTPLTDEEFEALQLRLMGKLVRVLLDGDFYESRSAVGIVTAVERPEDWRDGIWYARIMLNDARPWYLGGRGETWSVEIHEGGRRD